MNLRDPKHRMSVTFPGKPVTRCVSPDDIKRYLKARGYLPCLSIERDWPRDIAYAWEAPRRPEQRAAASIKAMVPRLVVGLRLCSYSLEQALETIAHNEGRTPGEVLREIAVYAQLENGE